VDISLNLLDNQRLNLSIKDNGVGFDTEEIEKSDGIGWKNIYTRLAIINGTMNIDSKKNNGTSVEINVIL
jgi:signal transduction histidine kinase